MRRKLTFDILLEMAHILTGSKYDRSIIETSTCPLNLECLRLLLLPYIYFLFDHFRAKVAIPNIHILYHLNS